MPDDERHVARRRAWIAVGGSSVAVALLLLGLSPWAGGEPGSGTTSTAATEPRVSAPAATSTEASMTQAPVPAPSTTQTPQPDPAPTDPSVMPVGDLPGWRQVFTEDFDTPVTLGHIAASRYAQTWLAYDGFVDTSGMGTYSPHEVLSVHGGALDWYVHTQNGRHLVSAVVPKIPETGWGQTYGRYSYRFRSDALPGYKFVAILWPDSDNWGEGEVDFPEVNQLDSSQGMYANLYPPGDVAAGTPGEPARFTTDIPANDTGWHVATIEWLPGSLTFVLDGVTLGTFTQGVPDTSFHLVFQVETNLDGVPPDDSVAGHVQLDWVTMYAAA